MALEVERLDNGVVVHQITDNPQLKCNIYCERPYCTANSSHFVYARQIGKTVVDDWDGKASEWEYIACEFGTWREQVVGRGNMASTVSYDGYFHYSRQAASGAREFVRVDPASGRDRVVLEISESIGRLIHPTVSKDGRYIAYDVDLAFDPQMFGIELADTHTGERRLIYRDQYICNSHAQFEPAEGKQVLTQINRGCEYSPAGELVKLLGDEGCTISLVGIDGDITPLAVGPPYTTSLTGHQAWIGETQEIIMTVQPTGEFAPERGNILCIRAGGEYRQIGAGWEMCHVGTTPCGRYFHADGGDQQEIIIGSPSTGKTVLICRTRTSRDDGGFGQCGHAHAYLSPDFRWVVFNSQRTGRPEIHVASIPEGLLEGLDN